MKKKLSLVLVVCLFVTLLSRSNIFASPDTIPENVSNLLNSFIARKIAEDTECTWTQSTSPDDFIKTYDPSNHVNQYIFNVTDNGVEQGQITINTDSSVPRISSYFFGGKASLFSMLEYYGYQTQNYINNSDYKIYYFGSESYALKTANGYIELGQNTAAKTEFSQAAVANAYSSLLAQQSAKRASDLQLEITGSANLLTGSRNGITPFFSITFNPVIMSDFSGHDKHCAPTAGTNLVKYWAFQKGQTKLQQSNSVIFNSLFSYMNTTNHGGTMYWPVNNAYTGLQSHVNSRGCSAPYKAQDSSPSFSEITTQLSKKRPVILACSKYPNASEGHFVCVVAYKTSDGNQLGVLNGWVRHVTYVYYSEIVDKNAFYIAYS